MKKSNISVISAVIVIALLLGFAGGALFIMKSSNSCELESQISEKDSEINDLINEKESLINELEESRNQIQEKDDAIYAIINHDKYDVTIEHDGDLYTYSANGKFGNIFSEQTKITVSD